MTDVRAALAGLNENQRKQLMYAFENLVPELIILPDRTFVGCNLRFLEKLEVTASHGPWMIGRVK